MGMIKDMYSIVGSIATSKRIKAELEEAALAAAQAELEWTKQERQREAQKRVEKKRKKERKILKKLKKAYQNAEEEGMYVGEVEARERDYRDAYLAYHGYDDDHDFECDQEYYESLT